MCPRTAVYVPSYWYICGSTAIARRARVRTPVSILPDAFCFFSGGGKCRVRGAGDVHAQDRVVCVCACLGVGVGVGVGCTL